MGGRLQHDVVELGHGGSRPSSLVPARDGETDGWQYIFANSAYWLQMREMWTGWPDREMDAGFKWYYLVQAAFWLQQILVVNIEERRKDHVQMFTHHLVTCSLIVGSYGYHYVKVGNVILCIMDSVDIILAVSLERYRRGERIGAESRCR